ncbi:MAG: histidinol dehydrogenase, partial [Rhodospirillaceae bacterium]|nr:histidinol dehydrogenase [Rhodospirillaceae bacterium]
MSKLLFAHDKNFEADFSALVNASRDEKSDVDGAVANILADVKKRGDEAVLEYTAKWDRQTLKADQLAFSGDDIKNAAKKCDAETLKALHVAAERIGDYHRRQMPKDELYTGSD